MPLIDLFFDQVFVDFLQLRAELLDPPGSSLDPSYLLYKFFVDFMKPKSDAARDKLLQDYNSSTVPWGPLNFDPQQVRPRQYRSWRTQWLEEKEKKKAMEKEKGMEKVVEESLPPTEMERESDWAILNREMSSHYDPSRYWFWKWLDEEEEKKERCAAEGRVYVDPTKPRPELEPARGDLMLTRDNTLVRRERYYRPSHPIYKEARIKHRRKHPEMSGFQYLTDAELKARGFEYVGYVPLAEKIAGRRLRQNFDSFMSSQSVKQEEEVVEMPLAQGEEEEEVVEMSLAQGEEEEGVEEEVAEEENDVKEEEEDDEWPFVAEQEFDVKEEEECDEWPSVEEEEYVEEEFVEEELDRSAHEEHIQEDDVERPLDEEENVEEAVRRPLVHEEENFEEDKRWRWCPSWVLNKSLLVLALMILALFCGLCIYSSSSVTYQNNGVGLSLKIHMSLPHPSRFRVDKLVSKVASSSVHIIIQSSRHFMYLADSNCDGWLTPT